MVYIDIYLYLAYLYILIFVIYFFKPIISDYILWWLKQHLQWWQVVVQVQRPQLEQMVEGSWVLPQRILSSPLWPSQLVPLALCTIKKQIKNLIIPLIPINSPQKTQKLNSKIAAPANCMPRRKQPNTYCSLSFFKMLIQQIICTTQMIPTRHMLTIARCYYYNFGCKHRESLRDTL